MIEPLEPRIAPAVTVLNSTTARWFDLDGDLVLMKLSKPVMNSVVFTSTAFGLISDQVTRIDLTALALEGVSVTITATPSDPGGTGTKFGDGFVNVGRILATGRHLGSVTLRGDLGEIDVGNGTGVALQSLSITSLFTQGTTTGASGNFSNIAGSVGKVSIAGDLAGTISVESGGNLGSATVGGSLLGGSADRTGRIFADGNLGPVLVKGSVIGGSSELAGTIGAGKNVSNVTIGGSLLGGSGNGGGAIRSGENGAGGTMGVIKIGGDVRGGFFTPLDDAIATGLIVSAGGIASVSIGGSLLQHLGEDSGRIVAAGDIGAVTIGGSIVGGNTGNDLGGNVVASGKITSITVRGSVIGGASDSSGTIQAGTIGKLSIRGDLLGGSGDSSGELRASAFGAVTIGGSILGGNDPDLFDANVTATGSGRIFSGGDIASLSIGDSIRGGNAGATGQVSIVGKIGSIKIGGDIIGAGGAASGDINAAETIGQVTIGGSLLGGTGNFSGRLSGNDGIGKVVIGGSVVGGRISSFSGLIVSANGPIGVVTIGGDLRGGDGPIGGATGPTDTGTIQGRRIGSVTIGGSIIAGGDFGPTPLRAGSIHAVDDIGSIVVKGSLLGSAAVPVFISASGQASAIGTTGATDIALKSLTIGGSVQNALLLFGYDKNLQGSNADAQVGTVRVGGNWTASYLIASVNPIDGLVGNGNDTRIFAPSDDAPISKIASIVIGGQVHGQAGSNNTTGFAAEQIGAMKVGGFAIPLLPGAHNDIFTNSFATFKARALGSTPSSLTLDGIAVHVFEV